MLDILAVSPHPDDVELCCGGLIAKLNGKRYHVGIVDLTKGELGTEGSGGTRVQEAAEAADALGVEIRENMDFGDCKLSSGFDEAVRLADVVRQYAPSVLIAPYGDDYHPDHRASRELVDKAAFVAKLAKIETGHKAHRVQMVAYYMLHRPFTPSFIVDVTDSYGRKKAAIKAYRSQLRLMFGAGGLFKSVELRDRLYGSKIGVKQGEPFFCRDPLKIDDPVALVT